MLNLIKTKKISATKNVDIVYISETCDNDQTDLEKIYTDATIIPVRNSFDELNISMIIIPVKIEKNTDIKLSRYAIFPYGIITLKILPKTEYKG